MTQPKTKPFQWTRTETLALGVQSCSLCHGMGLRAGRDGRKTPCGCVLRAIFRACYERFRDAVRRTGAVARTTYESSGAGQGWSMKHEEFVADFCLIAKRVLTPHQHKVFRFHYLLGGDWKVCCRFLKIERGEFFHECYRIEQKLGRTFRELKPYPLFPIDEYFHCAVHKPDAPIGYEIENEPAAAEASASPFPVAPNTKLRYKCA